MNLREIRKEVHNLPQISLNLKKFQDNWLKSIRNNSNSHLPFLKGLSLEDKKEINQKLESAQNCFNEIKKREVITQKLKSYSRCLIDLKLTSLQGNQQKSKMITNNLLTDDFLNFQQTIHDLKSLKENVHKLSSHYEEINNTLNAKLSLEETLYFMELPHRTYLVNLLKIADDHTKIVRHLGRHFIKLARENRK